MFRVITIFLVFLLKFSRAETFKFSGNPYSPRSDITKNVGKKFLIPYNTNSTFSAFQPPFQAHFNWPEKAGTYPIAMFLGGFFSEMGEYGYSQLISNLCKKGFIVVLSVPILGAYNNDKWIQQLQYIQANTTNIVQHFAETEGIYADTSKLLLFSHSSGAEIAKMFDNTSPEIVVGNYYSDPVFAHDEILNYQIDNSKAPGLVNIDSTEWCKKCCLLKKDNQNLVKAYENSGSAILYYENIYNLGHCSILNLAFAKICYKTQICHMEKDENRRVLSNIRDCEAGKMVAFWTDAWFNDPEMRQYYQKANEFCENWSGTGGEDNFCEGAYCL